MANEVKWIKIPSNFFELEPIKAISSLPDGDTLTVLYLELLCAAYRKSRKGIFSIARVTLTDEVLDNLFGNHYATHVGIMLNVLIDHGLIDRTDRTITVHKAWEDKRDRSSMAYKEWRLAVFDRDAYCCTKCRTTKDLQAHHIKPWKDYKKLRYDVSNGITLCRKCHLEAHGGRWNGGRK